MTATELQSLVDESIAIADDQLARSDDATTNEQMATSNALADLSIQVTKLAKHCLEQEMRQQPWYLKLWRWWKRFHS